MCHIQKQVFLYIYTKVILIFYIYLERTRLEQAMKRQKAFVGAQRFISFNGLGSNQHCIVCPGGGGNPGGGGHSKTGIDRGTVVLGDVINVDRNSSINISRGSINSLQTRSGGSMRGDVGCRWKMQDTLTMKHRIAKKRERLRPSSKNARESRMREQRVMAVCNIC